MWSITPELIATTILAENAHIDLDKGKKFVGQLTAEQIADLNKQGIDIDNSFYTQDTKIR